MTYVLIDVGCLECQEWSDVLWVEDNEQTARERFAAQVEERWGDRHFDPTPDERDLKDAPESLVLAAGTGGSYYYSLQLHRVDP